MLVPGCPFILNGEALKAIGKSCTRGCLSGCSVFGTGTPHSPAWTHVGSAADPERVRASQALQPRAGCSLILPAGRHCIPASLRLTSASSPAGLQWGMDALILSAGPRCASASFFLPRVLRGSDFSHFPSAKTAATHPTIFLFQKLLYMFWRLSSSSLIYTLPLGHFRGISGREQFKYVAPPSTLTDIKRSFFRSNVFWPLQGKQKVSGEAEELTPLSMWSRLEAWGQGGDTSKEP